MILSTPLGSTPLGSTPLGTTPLGTTPLGTTPIGVSWSNVRFYMKQNNLSIVDWSSLPKPNDDGKASHLPGISLPNITLQTTDKDYINLSSLSGITVLFVYPMTGIPNTSMPDGWDEIPGARGCTPQSCSFRDFYGEIKALGVKNLFGMSTQDTQYQREAVQRLHLPFKMLSDKNFSFSNALNMPTMLVDDMILMKRITLIINNGVVSKVFYPVFPPDKNPLEVISYLKQKRQ